MAMLLAIAERQPVLFILEDLHWTDPSTLELLDVLIQQAPTARMLILLTCRPEFKPTWDLHTQITSIALNRFASPQIELMVQKMTGGKTLPTEVAQHIVEKTDGVPLYVEEMTKMLLEADLLREEADAYVLSQPIADLVIPATLHDSLVARLDRLDRGKEIAQCAAAIGRKFEYDLLRLISGWSQAELDLALDELVDAGLVYQVAHMPSTVYIFKHALVRDATYGTLLRRTRQALHGRIAATLVAEFPDLTAQQPEVLAHHYTEANELEQALHYWLEAGRDAAQRSADKEAVAHLESGLRSLEGLPESEQRMRDELTFYLAMFGPLMSTKGYRFEQTGKVYQRARHLCETLGELRRYFDVLHGEWLQNFVKGDFRAANRLASEFYELSQKNDDQITLMDGHRLVAWTALNTGALEIVGCHIEQALRLSVSNQPHRPVHDAHVTGLACRLCYEWLVGLVDHARLTGEEMLAYAKEVGHANSLAIALMYKAFGEVMQRDVGCVSATSAELLLLAQEHDFPLWESLGGVAAGWAAARCGDPSGPASARASIDRLSRGGQRMWHPMFLALLAELYMSEGEAAQAELTLDEAFENLELTGGTMWEAELYRLSGELRMAACPEAPEQGEAALQRAVSVAQQQGALSLELRAVSSLAHHWSRQHRKPEALQMLATVYEKFNQGFHSPDLTSARSLMEQLSEN